MKKNAHPLSIDVQRRFFSALDILIANEKVNGLKGFCELGGFNRTKYSKIRSEMDVPISERKPYNYKFIDVAALAFICQRFNVSCDWLLLGKGKQFIN